MANFKITINQNGKVTLKTAEKYCDRDIDVTVDVPGGSTGDTDAAYQQGFDDGKQQGIAEGQQSEYDRFWDVYQRNGKRLGQNYLFYAERWTDENYNPKYDILCSSALSLFYASKISDTKVAVDCTDIQAHTVFAYCGNLHTIRKFVVSEATTYERTFISCNALENLTIEGTIGQNGFNVSYSKLLTHDSLMSIINALSTTSSPKTVTLGTENLAKLTEDEKAIATGKGWTLA